MNDFNELCLRSMVPGEIILLDRRFCNGCEVEFEDEEEVVFYSSKDFLFHYGRCEEDYFNNSGTKFNGREVRRIIYQK